MASLEQHTSYTGAYSGLLDNFWVTLAIAGICVVGHEIEIHIPRRRGRDGRYRRIPVRLFQASANGGVLGGQTMGCPEMRCKNQR